LTKRKSSGGLRVHQAIARDIGTAILTGKYKPGDSFGGEIEHSAELKISRTAYREAVRLLIAKGLIESRPKAGTHVTPRARWNLLDPEILAWMFAQIPDEAFVRDLFELRAIIEPEAAALAAVRRSDEHVREMREALDDMRTFGLAAPEGQLADRRFHHVMLIAAANEALLSLSSSVGAAVQWTTHFKQRVSEIPRDPIPEHEAVFAAIEKGSADQARTTMAELLNLALEDMDLGFFHAERPPR
jgi:DNA-binding FadR family transcriptional regulator